jgi:hypothetical protein
VKLEAWIAQLDVETAQKVQLAFNTAPFSAMENAELLAKNYAKKRANTGTVNTRLRAVRGAVEDAARRDVGPWHGAWPIVSAAAELAVWGFSTTESDNVREVLTAPVRAAGYRGTN